MKRLIAMLLCFTMLLTGCTKAPIQYMINVPASNSIINSGNAVEVKTNNELEFRGLDDNALLVYVEDLVYDETVTVLNSDEYVVESVNAIYISKEYIDEVAFNSQSNVFFGYTLNELNEIFQGSRYIITLSEDGETTVQELQEITDTYSEDIMKNVAIGTGVILVCVTVSVVSSELGAPAAFSAIISASAKSASIFALSSAAFDGIPAGIVRGYQTGDVNAALKAVAISGSEGFKWGAITGAVFGGAKEAFLLKKGTISGLTMGEVAKIQKESKLPMDIIKQIHTMEEYDVYKKAGLVTKIVNKRTALVQYIDLNYKSTLPDGTEVTNLTRMLKGYAPLDPVTGKQYNLHHIGQKADATLAVLTESQHQSNSKILNILGKESEIDRLEFDKIRKAFWKDLGNQFANGGV